MTDESYSFSTARTRLEEIVAQVRKKDTSLEKSLDLLEEGVRLANACTELIDHQDWVSSAAPVVEAEADTTTESTPVAAEEPSDPESEVAEPAVFDAETVVFDAVTVVEDVVVTDSEGTIKAEAVAVTEVDSANDFFDADDAWADESELAPSSQPDDPATSEG
jgi:exodeoxyribonuclease VII small subunit